MTLDVDAASPGGRTALALAALAAAELVLVGWAVTTRATLLFALLQALLLTLLALALLVGRFVRYRRSFEQALAESAAEHERSRLAEELHDLLGHELSLVALRAGAVQVSTDRETSARAAALRAQVERVVLELRQTVELLRQPQAASTVPADAEHDVETLAARSRAAGATVELDGRLDDAVPGPVRLTAFRIVREGLTNAAKHSPGSAVRIRQWREDDTVHVQVEADGNAQEDRSSWSGLASLDSRVKALGGTLVVTAASGRRTLRASLPLRLPSLTVPSPSHPHPRPARATARWALAPLVAVAALATAFYSWSTYDATLEQSQFQLIATGASFASVEPLLPRRQSPIRLTPVKAAPNGSGCVYYTDGNFPLGMAVYEICHDADRVTRTTDLRTVPLQ